MRQITNAVLAALLLLTAISCSKQGNTKPGVPGSPDSGGKKYAVKFNVGGDFTSEISKLRQQNANGRTNADTTVYTLYYFIGYGSQPRIIQKSTDPNFGVIVDSLPGGDYEAAVFVTNANVDSSLRFTTLMSGIVTDVGMVLPGGDFFSKALNFTVVGVLNQGLILDRVVSRVHLTVLDTLPFNASRMEIKSYQASSPPYDSINQGTEFGWANHYDYFNSKVLGDALVGQPDKSTFGLSADQLGKTGWNTYLYFFGAPGTKLNLVFTVYSSTNAVLTNKTIYGVDITTGNNTNLTGNLFPGVSSGAGLHIALPADTSWHDNTPKYF
ncbi:hypothetical protein DCC81_19310 [Chitinophaga parva]|uniref:DUF4397 domain-containing protein n=1 Tax=Chitinophaga parva TaxID=2169414 RepID=A0A2T7BBW5_9BACT|nr:hypothetical protein [Chitinophaga parva]PUZ22587.1 hypothetical protein DCC81_19310 [Chitinophaga parva]